MTQLPPTIPPRLLTWLDVADVQTAYNRCLLDETRLMGHGHQYDTPLRLVHVRILGYLIHLAPTDAGVREVVKAVNSRATDAKLHDLGSLYRQAFVRAFKSAKGRTPAPSNHPSRPSFDATQDMIYDTLDPAPRSHAASKKSALVRDGFRCLVTGSYDAVAAVGNNAIPAHLTFKDFTNTQCSHIFSESSNWDTSHDSKPNKRSWAASMWAVMSRFGYDSLPEDLNGDKVHRLENVLTLQYDIHKLFDSLGLWFVEVAPNTYRVETAGGVGSLFAMRGLPTTVTFTSTRPDLPLPSSDYLAIHAACAQIAHLSGASGLFEDLDDELDKHAHKTLANNGSSASLLYNALSAHAEV